MSVSTSTSAIEQQAINTIRTLAMDAVQQANSGHPGTPMALAPVAYTLWNEFLKYDPRHPHWPARDRFVLSCGHASMLLYAMLHLAGVRAVDADGEPQEGLSITLDDIRRFRQLGSPCAGHPEYGDAAGIETTTGPLGQGVGNSVGMAMAARWFRAQYDTEGSALFDFNVYAFCSDGDLMEGVGCEAASLAGHLGLSNLCWVYDDNRITIEGNTELAFSEDVQRRFEGLGWNTVRVDDANDLSSLRRAFEQFQATDDRPTLILVRSVIAFGSPNKADTHGAHGAPLGEDEVRLTKSAYGWPDEHFLVPDEVRRHFAEGLAARGLRAYDAWSEGMAAYRREHPKPSAELERMWSGQLPDGWDAEIPSFDADEQGLATRASSGQVLNAVAAGVPWFLGGSADLAPSNNTMLQFAEVGDFSRRNYGGRNLHFGVREHAMAAAANGLSLAGIRPYVGTFFVFTDYLRPSLRLSSIMHRPVLYILTHDSIGLGEDGPTHQPVEHLAACRAIPGLQVVRPADANEVAEAYRKILAVPDHPAALVLTRQKVPTFPRDTFGPAQGTARGGYVLMDPPEGKPEVILIGTGSEVALCVEAGQTLAAAGIPARVVSMPCWEWFDEQEEGYRAEVLPAGVTARVAVEAGIAQGWEKYLGPGGRFVGMQSFGGSAPYQELYQHFGLTVDNIVAAAKACL